MSEMINRIAEAMRLRAIDRGQPIHPTMAAHLAAAALEELRVPTVDMVAAAFPCDANEDFSFEDKQLGAAVCLKLGGWDKIGILNCEPIKQAAFLVRDYRLMIDAALRHTPMPDHQLADASPASGHSPQP